MKALVVVAHDDDAVLWMGGVIHHLKEWEWGVISMCNAHDEKRKGYFKKVCHRLGATPHAEDFRAYQDDKDDKNLNSITEMKDCILRVVGDTVYDHVFTHSRDPNGEYGYHANHREVCEAVKALVSEGRLGKNTHVLVHFSYNPSYNRPGLPTVARKDAHYYFQLSYSELAFKVALIRSFKDHLRELEEQLGAPCPNPEAFEISRLCLPSPPFIEGTRS